MPSENKTTNKNNKKLKSQRNLKVEKEKDQLLHQEEINEINKILND